MLLGMFLKIGDILHNPMIYFATIITSAQV